MRGYGIEAFNLAVSALNELASIDITPFGFSASYNVNGTLSGFVRPASPPTPSIVYDTTIFDGLGDPPEPNVADPNFVGFPTLSTPAPVYADPSKPNPLAASTVGNAPTTTSVTMPTEPTWTDPTLGTILTITLPTMEPITIPTFTAVAPVVDFTAPTGNIDFLPTRYSDDLLDNVKTQLSTMLQGGTGLPAAVEAALFARERGREDVAAAKAIQDVREEFAARGFSIPPGAQAARLMEIRQNTQNKSVSISRDVYIQAQTVAVENMRFAVTQSIAYQQMMISYDIQFQDMLLKAQQIMLDASIKVFDAQVSLFNAREQAYAIEAQVYRDRIQAELAKVEVYKAQLEGQRLIGEINQQTITLYTEQLRATTILVERYKAQLEAVNLIRDGDRLNIEIYRSKLQGRETEVRAWGAEWEGYRAQVEGQATRGNFYSAVVNGFASQVRAIAEQNNNQVSLAQVRAQLASLNLDGWKGKLSLALGKLEGEKTRIGALGTVFDAEAKILAAQASIESAAAEVDTRQFLALVENQKAEVDTYLKGTELNINQLLQISSQLIETRKAIAQVSSQLAASSFSAVHFSAGASSSDSRQMGSDCSTQYNYSGSL